MKNLTRAYFFGFWFSLLSSVSNAQFCIPSPTPSAADGGITVVRIIDHLNTGDTLLLHNSTEECYQDQSNVDAPLLNPGTLYRLQFVVTNTSYDRKFSKAWIDYNGDEDFDDPGEELYTWTSTTYTSADLQFKLSMYRPMQRLERPVSS